MGCVDKSPVPSLFLPTVMNSIPAKSISDICSGVILAGGMSTRFNGRNKAMIQIGGKRILDHIYNVYSELFTEIILVTNAPLEYLEWNLTMVTDIFPVRSSLTGIHAGMFHASRPFIFVSACDTPFIQKDIVRMIVSQAGPGADAVMPETSKGLEPLCAAYAVSQRPSIEAHLREGKFKIQRIFRKSRIRKISETQLRQADPEGLSFININTPEDLSRVSTPENGISA